MAHRFHLNQRVKIQGFESHGTIVTMPYNDESEVYIVAFDRPQSYSISNGSRPALYAEVIADAKYLKAE